MGKYLDVGNNFGREKIENSLSEKQSVKDKKILNSISRTNVELIKRLAVAYSEFDDIYDDIYDNSIDLMLTNVEISRQRRTENSIKRLARVALKEAVNSRAELTKEKKGNLIRGLVFGVTDAIKADIPEAYNDFTERIYDAHGAENLHQAMYSNIQNKRNATNIRINNSIKELREDLDQYNDMISKAKEYIVEKRSEGLITTELLNSTFKHLNNSKRVFDRYNELMAQKDIYHKKIDRQSNNITSFIRLIEEKIRDNKLDLPPKIQYNLDDFIELARRMSIKYRRSRSRLL